MNDGYNKGGNHLKWLWLEDKPDSVRDIDNIFHNNNMEIIATFKTPNSLTKYIIKQIHEPNFIKNYGLIIDCQLLNQDYIIVPPELVKNNTNTLFRKTTGNCNDTGILYYEQVIMGMGIKNGEAVWNPYPPVLFISIIEENFANITDRLKFIRAKWANVHKIDDPEKSKVQWISKWQIDNKYLSNLLTQWERS